MPQKKIRIELHPGQTPAWKSEARFVGLIAGTGGGKALALDTLIPTPNGFKKMKDIEEGDIVFDGKGRKTAVSYVSPVYLGNRCYRVCFDDGSEVIADAEHFWVVQTAKQRKNTARWKPKPTRVAHNKQAGYSVVTTEDMASAVKDGDRLNFSVDITPFEGQERELPIPPYVFGVWLGDGTATCSEITSADNEILEYIKAEGVTVGKPFCNNSGRAKCYRLGSAGKGKVDRAHDGTFVGAETLQGKLRQLGVLGNKHIPQEYLFSSFRQRLALLQGLMDTDGYIAEDGRCEFTSSSKRLIEDVAVLLSGLGIKNKATVKEFEVFGKKRITYRICFTTNLPVFRLRRKAERLPKEVRPSTKRRFVTKVEKVESVPVRCIAVQSPECTYMCTPSFIVTHNTWFGARWLHREILRHPQGRFLVIAPSYPTLERITLPETLAWFDQVLPGKYKEQKKIFLANCGARVFFGSAEKPFSLEGPHVQAVWMDEAGQMKRDAWAVAQRRVGFHQGRILITSTPYNMGWLKTEFYDEWRMGDPDYFVSQFPSTMNPKYPREEFERARRKMPEWEFEMFWLGQFRRPAGLIFSEFDPAKHVRKLEVPPEAVRFMGYDFGWDNPSAALWGALLPNGVLYVYREYYKSFKTDDENATEISQASEGENIERMFCDPAEPDGIATMRKFRLPAVGLKVGVLASIKAVISRLKTGRILFAPGLKFTFDEIEQWVWKRDLAGEATEKPEDKNDHLMTCLRLMVAGIDGVGHVVDAGKKPGKVRAIMV